MSDDDFRDLLPGDARIISVDGCMLHVVGLGRRRGAPYSEPPRRLITCVTCLELVHLSTAEVADHLEGHARDADERRHATIH